MAGTPPPAPRMSITDEELLASLPAQRCSWARARRSSSKPPRSMWSIWSVAKYGCCATWKTAGQALTIYRHGRTIEFP